MENFITIKENIQDEIIVKKSKFICNIYIVNTIEEAEKFIKETKKKYHDAKHNCIAYRVIENEKIIEKSSDDGEPSGTAGTPILNILQKNSITNILVVVTRYFGGILLGTGGLVRAYSDATLKALNKVEKIEKCMGIELEAKMQYDNLEIFKYYCRKNNINIINIEYSNIIVCKIELEERKNAEIFKDFETKIINLIDLRFLSKKIIDKCIIKR